MRKKVLSLFIVFCMLLMVNGAGFVSAVEVPQLPIVLIDTAVFDPDATVMISEDSTDAWSVGETEIKVNLMPVDEANTFSLVASNVTDTTLEFIIPTATKQGKYQVIITRGETLQGIAMSVIEIGGTNLPLIEMVKDGIPSAPSEIFVEGAGISALDLTNTQVIIEKVSGASNTIGTSELSVVQDTGFDILRLDVSSLTLPDGDYNISVEYVSPSSVLMQKAITIPYAPLGPVETPTPTPDSGETSTPTPTPDSGETSTPTPTPDSGETSTPTPTPDSGETPTPTPTSVDDFPILTVNPATLDAGQTTTLTEPEDLWVAGQLDLVVSFISVFPENKVEATIDSVTDTTIEISIPSELLTGIYEIIVSDGTSPIAEGEIEVTGTNDPLIEGIKSGILSNPAGMVVVGAGVSKLDLSDTLITITNTDTNTPYTRDSTKLNKVNDVDSSWQFLQIDLNDLGLIDGNYSIEVKRISDAKVLKTIVFTIPFDAQGDTSQSSTGGTTSNTDTRSVTGILKDANGSTIDNGMLELVLIDSILNKQNYGYVVQNMINIDSNNAPGQFEWDLIPGEYRIFRINDFNALDIYEDDEWHDVDMYITIPDGTTQYDIGDIQLPSTFNVTGTAQNVSSEIELGFISAAYNTTEWQNALNMDPWLKEMLMIKTETDANGYFEMNLGAGDYSVLGRMMGAMVNAPQTPVTFTVVDGTPFTLDGISFTAADVTGNLALPTGVQFEQGMIKISKEDDDTSITTQGGVFATVSSSGYFEVLDSLEANTGYKIDSIMLMPEKDLSQNGVMIFPDVTFTTGSNGLIQSVSGSDATGTTSIDIDISAFNVKIALQMGGQDVSEGEIEIAPPGEEYGPFVFSDTGNFDFYIQPNLEYTVKFINTFGGTMIENFNKIFSVDSSGVLTYNGAVQGTDTIIIDLASASNVTINSVDSNNNPINIMGVSIEALGDTHHQWVHFGNTSTAYTNLKPGSYKINGYDTGSEWKNTNIEFTIVEAEPTTPYEVTITQKGNNVVGKVVDPDNAGQYIANANINIVSMVNGYEQYFWFMTDSSGDFSTSLDPGDYLVKDINWQSGSNWMWEKFDFKFRVESDLSLSVPNESGTYVSVSGNFEIAKPADNVSGYVYKSGTTPYSGKNFEGQHDVQLVLVDASILTTEGQIDWNTTGQEMWKYEIWTPVSANGSFSVNLDTSKTYAVRAIFNGGQFIEILGTGIDNITAPNTSVEITPPAANFNGLIQDINGQVPTTDGQVPESDGSNLYSNIFLNLENTSNNMWQGVNVDIVDGTFSGNLEAGATYKIREVLMEKWTVSGADIGGKEEKRLSIEKEITIGTDSTNLTLKPNVTATFNLVDKEPNGAGSIHWSEAMIKPVYDSGSEPADFLQEPWKYEKRMSLFNIKDGSGNPTSEYKFEGCLEDGQYKLAGIPLANEWMDLNVNFKIDPVSPINATYTNSIYTLSFDISPNVTGIITNSSSTAVSDAWVNMRKIADSSGTSIQDNGWEPDNYVGTKTNSNGEFALKLDDATYKLMDYSTPGQWDASANMWMPGEFVRVGFEFKVVGGVLKNTDDTELASISIQPNVKGKALKIFKTEDNAENFVEDNPSAGDYVTIKDAWITIKPTSDDGNYTVNWEIWEDSIWTNTDRDTGVFNLMLKDGYYKIVDIGSQAFWMKSDINFQVSGGNVVMAAGYEGNLNSGFLEVKRPAPNTVGKAFKDEAGTEPLAFGRLVFKPATALEHEWENAVWVETDEYGNFETKLSIGEWKIVEMNAHEFWMKMAIPVTVQGDNSLASTLNGVVDSNGDLVVKPMTSLTGIVKDEQGNTISQNAWITIKPTTASHTDWSQAIGVEYNDFDKDGVFGFSMFLEDGEYRVVDVGSNNFSYNTDIRFDIVSGVVAEVVAGTVVGGNLIVSPPVPNVNGSAYGDNSQALINGWVNITRVDSSGNQVTMSGDAIPSGDKINMTADMDYNWMHTFGAEIQNGSFEFFLDVGNYKVIWYGGEVVQGQWIGKEVDVAFTVVSGVTSTISLTPPADNVTITIASTGIDTTQNPSVFLDVSMFETHDGETFKIFKSVASTSVDDTNSANGTYTFSGNIPDGDYTIEGVWHTGGRLEIGQEVTVSGTLSHNIDMSASSTKKIVQGSVTNNNVEKVYITLAKIINGTPSAEEQYRKKVQSETNGNFDLKLEEGTTWTVVNVITSSGYNEIANTSNFEHTVIGDDSQVSGTWAIDLSNNGLFN